MASRMTSGWCSRTCSPAPRGSGPRGRASARTAHPARRRSAAARTSEAGGAGRSRCRRPSQVTVSTRRGPIAGRTSAVSPPIAIAQPAAGRRRRGWRSAMRRRPPRWRRRPPAVRSSASSASRRPPASARARRSAPCATGRRPATDRWPPGRSASTAPRTERPRRGRGGEHRVRDLRPARRRSRARPGSPCAGRRRRTPARPGRPPAGRGWSRTPSIRVPSSASTSAAIVAARSAPCAMTFASSES